MDSDFESLLHSVSLIGISLIDSSQFDHNNATGPR
jgi:hypothetical protein